MSFIQFESASEKEKIRQELRNAREELLSKAKQSAENRAKAEVERKLRGEDKWMLPSLSEKIEEQSKISKKEKKSKKSSKGKKHKYEKKKRKKPKEEKKEKHKKKSKRGSSTDESSDLESSTNNTSGEDEWVEKKVDIPAEVKQPLKRDEWLTDSFLLPTYIKNVESKEKPNIDAYDPAKSTRELNPYWKDGGKGLPTFQKPKDDDYYFESKSYKSHTKEPSGNWRKKGKNTYRETVRSSRKLEERRKSSSSSSERESTSPRSTTTNKSTSNLEGTSNFLTDQQMNELGAKLIKAEIMGNDELVKELKEKLEKAREVRNQIKKQEIKPELPSESGRKETEHILLTTTDHKGVSRPLTSRSSALFDPYGGKTGKRRNIDTHEDGKRIKYFPDDDRYDIKQMFEREKYATASQSDAQFAEIAGKYKNTKDDLEDIFADKVRKEISDKEEDEKERKRAIREHEQFSKVLDSCDKCFNSSKMEKQLLVSMGSTVYLTMPWHEGLQPGHCMIVPIQHISCSTQLDEDTWAEVNDFRKALTRMFAARSMDVIFFEIVRYLSRRPHMAIHCIPSKNFEMAPFYFKKAIQESEHMWSTNKQLIPLNDKDVRRAIPRGLPYFWVHFGMDSGFAHVIEDQERFPANFAREIIGGMLELDSRVWRKPRREQNSIQKVKQFAEWWKPYDCTT